MAGKNATKDKPDADDKGKPPVNDAGDGSDDGGDGDDAGELTRGDLQQMIRDELAAALPEALKGITGKPAGDAGDKGGDDDKGKPRSAAAQETDMRALVRAEVDEIRKGDEIIGRLGKLEESVKETPPAPVRRLTKAMWS